MGVGAFAFAGTTHLMRVSTTFEWTLDGVSNEFAESVSVRVKHRWRCLSRATQFV